jgi:hypothetical protein
VIENAIELVDGLGSKCVSNLGTIESDPHTALIQGTMVGHVLEIESGDLLPTCRIEDFRNHEIPPDEQMQ